MPRKKKLQTEEEHDEARKEAGPAPSLNGFKKKRSLTLEVRSISKMAYAIFRCDGELVTSDMPSKFSKSGKAEAISVDVTDATSGEQYTLVLNAVAASALKRAGTPLVGRHFEISVGGAHEGKRYRDTEVNELEEGE
jgi:hypothetical protein